MSASKFLNKLSSFSCCMALLCASSAAAQDLNETFTVLGEYIPDIIRQDKIHTLHRKTLFTMPQSEMPYATAGLPGSFSPSVGVVDPPLWNARLQEPPRGYIGFGMGNYFNMTGSAGYRFIDNASTQAGLWLQHNSWWGFHPNLSPQTADYEKQLVNDRIGGYIRHTFTAGTLSANLRYHGAWFNYYGSTGATPSGTAPTQTIFNPSASVAWKGATTGRWDYSAALDYHYFAFRRFAQYSGQNENAVTLNTDVAFRLDESSAVALTIAGGAYLYSNPLNNNAPATDYGLISLTPQYRYAGNNIRLTAGADLGFAINTGQSILSPYSRDSRLFNAAPHVSFTYTGGIAALSLQAKGGLKANTLQAAADADIYTLPLVAETTPQYTPIDARIAIALNPHRVITAAFRADYAITEGLYPGGDYMLHIADPTPAASSTIYGFRLGTDITLRPVEWCSIAASLDYSPQHGDHGYFNGYDRPRWILDATARFTPTDRITLALNYNYRGVRNHYRTLTDGTAIRTRLHDLTYLNARASWRIIKPLTIWLQARNILGCSADILPGQPAPRATLTAGFALTF